MLLDFANSLVTSRHLAELLGGSRAHLTFNVLFYHDSPIAETLKMFELSHEKQKSQKIAKLNS